MKILQVKKLIFPEIKVIRFGRFTDKRGYFTESFRQSDFYKHSKMPFMKNVKFVQVNESFSKKGTIRGLHFQWNPYVGKLVRTIRGHMVDMVLDIRKASPNFGKIICYDMSVNSNSDYNDWIWVPPGFAHGNFFLADTIIEYFCTGEYNPSCEASISPLSLDIDWFLGDKKLKNLFYKVANTTNLITKKDRRGFTVSAWEKDGRSSNFTYGS